jgi:small subunit ribosomal protein S17
MEEQAKKINLRGTVVSNSENKTVRVRIDYKTKHPQYGKYINRSTKLGVHDEENQAVVGDVVEISECRPMSKTKTWQLVRVIQKAVIK